MTRAQPAQANRNGRSLLSTGFGVEHAGHGMVCEGARATDPSGNRVRGLDTAVMNHNRIVKTTAPPTNKDVKAKKWMKAMRGTSSNSSASRLRDLFFDKRKATKRPTNNAIPTPIVRGIGAESGSAVGTKTIVNFSFWSSPSALMVSV